MAFSYVILSRGAIPPSLCRIPILQWRFVISTEAIGHGSGSTVRFQNPDGWETSFVGTDYRQEYSVRHYCFLSETCRPSGRAVSAGGEKPCRINTVVWCLPSSGFPFVGNEASTTDKPLPCARSATVSLHSATIGGAYLRILCSVSERCIKRRCC